MLRVAKPSLASAARRCKIVLLGSSGVGKSSLMTKMMLNKFSEAAVPTLGAEMITKEEAFKAETTTLHVWDCSGAERYKPLLQQLYSDGVAGVVLAYDCSSERSFQDLAYWHNEVVRCCPSACVMIVACKSDLTEEIKISAEDGAKQAKEWGCTHVSASAKSGLNVDSLFTFMLALIKKTQA